jgi:hypothetical protein
VSDFLSVSGTIVGLGLGAWLFVAMENYKHRISNEWLDAYPDRNPEGHEPSFNCKCDPRITESKIRIHQSFNKDSGQG